MIEAEAMRKPGGHRTGHPPMPVHHPAAVHSEIGAQAEVEAARLAVSLVLAVIKNSDLAEGLRTYRKVLDAALSESDAALVAATRTALDAIFSDARSIAARMREE